MSCKVIQTSIFDTAACETVATYKVDITKEQ